MVRHQWRTQDFRMEGVKVPQAPRGVRGILPPTGRGVWEGPCLLPRKFVGFFIENTIFWRILTRLFLTSSVREYVFYVFFQISKKHDFLRFFEMTYQKVVKSRWQKLSPQSFRMSSHTSLSDHCNSIPSFRSVIHSEPLLNILPSKFLDVTGIIGVYYTQSSVA